MTQTNGKLEDRTKMMCLIAARDGGLIQTTNGAGQRIWVLTEEAQDFVERNLDESRKVIA